MRMKGLLILLIGIAAFAVCHEGFGQSLEGAGEAAPLLDNASTGGVFAVVSRRSGDLQPAPPSDEPGDALEERFQALKDDFKDLAEELKKIPESEGFKKFQREMDRFGEDLKRSGDAIREKMKKDVLPQLERKMERFREWLDELEGKEAPQPMKI